MRSKCKYCDNEATFKVTIPYEKKVEFCACDNFEHRMSAINEAWNYNRVKSLRNHSGILVEDVELGKNYYG
jgi:hypothetical protein